jgi:hypothetical protein
LKFPLRLGGVNLGLRAIRLSGLCCRPPGVFVLVAVWDVLAFCVSACLVQTKNSLAYGLSRWS